MAEINKLPLFVRCVIQNFPFIEEDFDALSNYELISKVVEYLNKVIASQNEVIGVANELQEAFVQLQNYVEHYFDNLDVQEEINNKLDAMVEAGTLQEIIGEYLNATAVWGFDTVADMKASTNLINGSFAKTLGYHAKNDGGTATYKIREITNADTVDEMLIIAIGSGTLIAELIISDSVCPEMLGAYGDGTHDDTTAIQKAVTLNTKVVLSKEYVISSTVRIGDNPNIDIDGAKSLITYTGDEYAFLFQHINGGVARFGRITSDTGGCIKFYSALGTADRVQYFKLHFNILRASTTKECIYAKCEGTGWLNEIEVHGGCCNRGTWGFYMDNLSSTSGGIGAWKVYNVGFEGTTNNIYINSATETNQRGHYFSNLRYVEHTTAKLFEMHGKVERLTMESWGGLEESRVVMDYSKVKYIKLICPIYSEGTVDVIATGIYYHENRKRYLHDNTTWKLQTKNTTNVSSGNIRLVRQGNLCIIRMDNIVTTNASGNLVDLLDSYPKEIITSTIANNNGTKFMRVYTDISTGALKFNMPSDDVGTSYSGEISYFVDLDITP